MSGGPIQTFEYPIGDDTTFRWAGYRKPVYRFRLHAEMDSARTGYFKFFAEIISKDTMLDTCDEVATYAQGIAQNVAERALEGRAALDVSILRNPSAILNSRFLKALITPFDVKVPQCWIILELDPGIKNWEWMRDRPAVTAKHIDPPHLPDSHGNPKNGHNVCLRHVYPTGACTGDPSDRPNDSCRVVFFGVVHRTGKNSSPPALGSHLMNFRTQFFFDPVNGEIPTLQVPADPDVGNEGPDEFPSPP